MIETLVVGQLYSNDEIFSSLKVSNAGGIRVSLQIVPDEDNPHAVLRAHDESGEALGEARVRPDFKLNTASAEAWIEGGFQKPR